MRVGLGYDVHKFESGRPLIIGGVRIPYEAGLAGHSDADVLTHAVMDALLGAAGLGDIGEHFPDTDPAYRGADSIKLLSHVADLLDEHFFVVENLDCIIVAQAPKMSPYKEEMRKNIADALGIEPDRINIKATTEEGLGFTGEKLGISSKVICLIEKMDDWSTEIDPSGGGCSGCGCRH